MPEPLVVSEDRAVPPVDRVNADERRSPDPVDGEVGGPIDKDRDGDVTFSILLPPLITVTAKWTGYFTANGKKLPNTDFGLVKVNGTRVIGSIPGKKHPSVELYSDTVRLFAPGVVH